MTLLEECIEKLGIDYEVCGKTKSQQIFDEFESKFPLTKWGRINWEKIEKKTLIKSCQDIADNFIGEECFILWDELSLPVIRSTIHKVLSVVVDVTAVSFDTWIVNFETSCVLEFHHEGEITIGVYCHPQIFE